MDMFTVRGFLEGITLAKDVNLMLAAAREKSGQRFCIGSDASTKSRRRILVG
jgi:hypothetical protein